MFDWGNYLVLANELLSQSNKMADKEACYRCAISRAYYCAFHKAKQYLIRKGITLNSQNKAGSHKEVIDKLFVKAPKAGSDLFRLKENRIKSDYHVSALIDEGLVIQSIACADAVLIELDNHSSE
jgi:uncharacterized protein (UPF0332 family)